MVIQLIAHISHLKQNVSLALNAVLPISELAQLSEVGEGFAKEGEAARSKSGSSVTEKVAEHENNQATEREVRTGEKVWITGESPLCSWLVWLTSDSLQPNFCINHDEKMATVKSTVTTVSPMLRISLTILGDISNLTPIPMLSEAARILLAVWEAVDTVEVSALIVLFSCL